jgi:general stress protein CsbA
VLWISLGRYAKLQNKTISAILVWIAIAMLLLNGYFKSQWIFLIGIAIVVIAITVYFFHRLTR